MVPVVINQIRPHQLVHQLAVVVVLCGFGRVPLASSLLAYGIAVLGTVAMLLYSDYQHRHEDAKMGRRRLAHVLGERLVLRGTGASLLALVGLTLWIGGLRCLLFVIAVFLATAVYTRAKKQRRPVASYLGRAAAGVLLVGVYASIFTTVEIPALVPFAIAAGLLDLAGNLAGDLRDHAEDRRAGLQTLPLRRGGRTTVIAIVVLLLMAHGLVAASIASPSVWLVSVVLGPLVTAVAVTHVSRRWMHAAAHGPKLGQLLLIGAALQGTDVATVAGACLGVGSLWLVSYWAYVWSLERVEITRSVTGA